MRGGARGRAAPARGGPARSTDLEQPGCAASAPPRRRRTSRTRTEQYAALPEGDPRRLDADAAARLRARLPEVEAWADRLLGLGLPLTFVHNDLHGNNVFSVDGRMRFFDFGDAVLGDPLSVLLVVVRSLMFRLECEPGRPAPDPRVARRHSSRGATSRRCRSCATRWTPACSWASWRGPSRGLRCLGNLTDAETAEFGDAGTYWLQAIEASALQTE